MVKIPKIIKTFWDFFDSTLDKSVIILVGGAGSGKSQAICQRLIYKLYTESNIRMLILRKTFPSLRITTYQMMMDLLEEYDLQYNINKSEMTLTVNENIIWFRSLDQPEKLKSLNLNTTYIEEASEITHKDFLQVRLRMRRASETRNQIILSLNPDDQFMWIKTEVIDKNMDDIVVHHSTYHDNPFLPPEYKEELEGLKKQDINHYMVYAKGEWGIKSNTVYSNYTIDSKFPDEFEDEWYGLDFGHVHPSVLIFVGRRDNRLYLKEIIYKSYLTNNDLIGLLKKNVLSKTVPIYADSAEPARIEEISRADFNIYPAEKKVSDGIDAVKRYQLHIHPNSVHIIDEIRSYSWREDRNGRILDEPVKFNDDCMDSLRYAVFTHTHRPPQIKSIPTSVGGGSLGRLRG